MTTLQEKLGSFCEAGLALSFDGDRIVAGETVVSGPWGLYTKDQIAAVVGVVTESMLNSQDDDGNPVYEFQGNGWRPKCPVGHILLADTENPNDRWGCEPGIFEDSSGWQGIVKEDGSVTYAKAGKPILAMPIEPGVQVKTLEGEYTSSQGAMLVVTDADKGDFFLWMPDTVEAKVKPYKG